MSSRSSLGLGHNQGWRFRADNHGLMRLHGKQVVYSVEDQLTPDLGPIRLIRGLYDHF